MNTCIRCRERKEPEQFPFPEQLRGKGVRVASLMPSKAQRRVRRKRSTVCRDCWRAEIKRKRAERAGRAKHRAVQTRKCSECGRRKALNGENFDPLPPYADGTLAFRLKCKDCRRAAHRAHHREVLADPERAKRMKERVRENGREWKRRNRERERELQRAYRKRVQADPKRRARRLELNRMAYRLKRIREGRPAKMTPRRPASGPRLPVAPLAAVLDRLISRNGASQDSLCEEWGINSREVRAYLSGERTRINATKADEYLTALGLNWWDVWWCDDHDELTRDCEACQGVRTALRAF